MAFEPNFEKVVSSCRTRLGSTQAIVECKLPLEDGNGLQKVLCVNAKAYIEKSDIEEKEIKFEGCVGFQIIYLDENSCPQSMDYTAGFNDKLSLESGVVGVPISTCEVIDVKYVVDNSEIKITAIIETKIDLIADNESKVLVGLNDEKSFCKNETLNYLSFSGVVEDRFDVQSDIEIKDSVKKILSVFPTIYINKLTLNDKFMTISGNILVNICYTTDEEKTILRTYQTEISFNQEISDEKINDESVVYSLAYILLNEVKITTSIDVNSANVNVLFPVKYKGFLFDKKCVDFVSDLFNVHNDLKVNYESLNILNVLDSDFYEEKITGEISVDDNMPFIDEVTGVCCNNVVVANSKMVEGGVLIEGVATTNVLYYNKEFDLTTSLIVEMPFSKELDCKNIPNNFEPIISVEFGDVYAKGKRGKEISIDGKLFVYVDYCNQKTEALISDVELADEKIEEDCVLNIYIVKDGENIWDVAKEMLISPDELLEQNPDLELPLKSGDKVVVYKPKLAEF